MERKVASAGLALFFAKVVENNPEATLATCQIGLRTLDDSAGEDDTATRLPMLWKRPRA